jgi:putative endonuclease
LSEIWLWAARRLRNCLIINELRCNNAFWERFVTNARKSTKFDGNVSSGFKILFFTFARNKNKTMAKHNEIGQYGETLAAAYLQQKEYVILHQNWRFGRAEIDIIARQRQVIVFVEVKTRSNDDFDAPKDAVKRKKERLMIRAANAFMEQIGHEGAIRFDIIGIVLHGDAFQIDHLEDAFFPGFFYD